MAFSPHTSPLLRLTLERLLKGVNSLSTSSSSMSKDWCWMVGCSVFASGAEVGSLLVAGGAAWNMRVMRSVVSCDATGTHDRGHPRQMKLEAIDHHQGPLRGRTAFALY